MASLLLNAWVLPAMSAVDCQKVQNSYGYQILPLLLVSQPCHIHVAPAAAVSSLT
jgi:hypothetical protein